MRKNSVPKVAKPAVRILGAAILASAAAGCSSDVSRFSGGELFSGTDRITTSSIPDQRREITGLNGGAPVPRADVAGEGGYGVAAAPPANRSEAMSQPFPGQGAGVYDGVSTSSARSAAAPVAVERAALSAPPAASADPSTRREALAQPFPAANAGGRSAGVPDPIVTGTTSPQVSKGWSTVNAPRVTLKPGETVATLSNRYGVPEKEILAANGLPGASAAVPGQSIVIPTFNAVSNAARASTQAGDLPERNDQPMPPRPQEQNVAVLPAAPQLRDKSQAASSASTMKATPGQGKPEAGSGAYVVQSGDTLTKIARNANVSVASLKDANGLSTESIRVGQTLKLPSGAAVAAGEVRTASIPARQPEAKPAPAAVQQPAAPAAAAAAPQPYKAPVATESVSDVEKKSDVTASAPQSTGIEKYRWPVRGAVIARFGENVGGKRSDGIDISVPEGTPVKAAENGVVIYAGNGLKELGNTVLVRHDDGKVTVYGNASELSVQRGQKVQRGQTIATSGMSGSASRPQLHFEVRKDATPVNPATFLE